MSTVLYEILFVAQYFSSSSLCCNIHSNSMPTHLLDRDKKRLVIRFSPKPAQGQSTSRHSPSIFSAIVQRHNNHLCIIRGGGEGVGDSVWCFPGPVDRSFPVHSPRHSPRLLFPPPARMHLCMHLCWRSSRFPWSSFTVLCTKRALPSASASVAPMAKSARRSPVKTSVPLSPPFMLFTLVPVLTSV